jgi:hypothetical protein
MYDDLFVSVDFRPLFLFAHVVFPRFVYTNMTLETVALHTPNNLAVFVTDAPAKRMPVMSSFKIGQVSHFLILSHGLSLNTTTNALTRALQSVKKRKNIQCCQLKFFQCSQYKQILFLSVSVILFTLCAYRNKHVTEHCNKNSPISLINAKLTAYLCSTWK